MLARSTAVRRAHIGTSLKAEDTMERPVIAATPQASLRDVATQLVPNEFSGMPVAASDGRVVGVITESDIVRTLIQGKRLENLTAANNASFSMPTLADWRRICECCASIPCMAMTSGMRCWLRSPLAKEESL